MQKAITPSSVLSIAFTADKQTTQIETHLYVVKEKNKKERNAASHLHSLFFGNKTHAVLQIVAYENKAGEPDYFSSYE